MGVFMKKITIFLVFSMIIINSVFSIDPTILENAIIDYVPNARTKSYFPVLLSYGFSENEVNSWRFTTINIEQYFDQIYQVLSSKQYTNISGPNHFISNIRAIGEIKGDKLENLTVFFNDIHNVAQEINSERLKILDKKIIENKNGLIIYGYNITYDGNGHIEGTVPIDEKLYRSGELAELKTNVDLKKEGYKFMGWSQNIDATSWLSNPKINVNRDLLFYAVWIDNETLNRMSANEILRQNNEKPQNIGYTVYIGQSGTKYHSASCRSLRKSKIAININSAKSRGYTACKLCNP